MWERFTRRGVIRGVVAAWIAGLLGSGVASANDRRALDRHIIGVVAGRDDVAHRAADQVYRVLDFGDIGMAVSGWYPDEAIDNLRRNPNVRYIEAEGEMRIVDHTVEDGAGDPSEVQVLPWGIGRVGADTAHHAGDTGSGASIAIIDTGIDPTHETLGVAGGHAFVDCEGECSADWDDDHGHGTHCAGTAGARDNGIGVVGASTAAEVYAVKVLDDGGGGTFTDVAAGIEWTADQGIDVGSLSLGGGHSETVEDSCRYAHGNGTLLVAAAGNGGPRPRSVRYPAAYEEVIAVSAVDGDDEFARFSSRGDEIELAAPGVDVLSSVPGNGYERWNGTSMACPHVSGAGALLMADGDSNTAARDRLNATAEDIGLSADRQGNGLLDVAAALGVEEEDDDEDEEGEASLAVQTQDATEVDESSATLNGDLTELEGYDEANVYFEWGEIDEDLPHTTDEQTLDSTGEFGEDLTDLDSDTEYEFRAVAQASDDKDTGETLTLTTTGGDGEFKGDPVIEEWSVSTRTTGPWYRADVEWEVSDPDGSLAEVTSELLGSDGDVLDSQTSGVSGETANGEHALRSRDEPAEVRLTVSDEGGNETSETKDY